MFAFDRTVFFSDLEGRAKVKLTTARQDALDVLLRNIEADAALTMLRQAAYLLATVRWETADTFLPIKERRFNLAKNPAEWKRQDRYWKTGYYGRGYVQLTWERNYQLAGQRLAGTSAAAADGSRITVTDGSFVENPDLVMQPDFAYSICSSGMREGWFTGKKLGDYIVESAPPDYRNARRVVNGLDRCDEIAAYANQFELVLRASTQHA